MSELDRVRQLWADRGTFQGCAQAYIRYSERKSTSWSRFEKPLWEHLLKELNLADALLLDVGTGPGKHLDLFIECGADPNNIYTLEPNIILFNHLRNRDLGISCIYDDVGSLDNPILQAEEFDMVTANMVTNHISTFTFNKFASDAKGILKPDGLFVYTIPEPLRKAHKYSIEDDDNSFVAEEIAPWGGLVDYHHRSEDYQRKVLESCGFEVFTRVGGYDDTWHTNDGPKRMIVVAGKKDVSQVSKFVF